MKEILFFLFVLTLFMPRVNISGLTISDVFLVLNIFILFFQKIGLSKFERGYFKVLFFFLLLYLLEEIVHIVLSLNYYSYMVFVADKIAYVYFFILSFVIISFSHIIKKNKFIQLISVSLVVNSIILPYFFLLMNIGNYNKLSSLFVKPNQLALFLILTPVIFILLDYAKNRDSKNIHKINYFILLLYPPMLATASKSGLLVLFLMHVVIFIFSYKKLSNAMKIIYVMILISFFLLLNPVTFEYFLSSIVVETFPQFNRVAQFLFFSDSIQTFDSFRNINNREGLQIFSDHPFFGVGFGLDILLTSTGHEIHNTYIRILATLGIIGSLFFTMFSLYYIFLFKVFFQTFIIICLIGIVFIYGVYHDIFTSRYYFFMYVILIYTLSSSKYFNIKIKGGNYA